MSDELRLSDELAACEARLAAHSLESLGIHRDELLYRAGWAACEAASNQKTLSISSKTATRRTLAGWCAASAAIAAMLTVTATMALRIDLPSRVELAAQTTREQSVGMGDATPKAATPRTTANNRLLAQLDALAAGRASGGGRISSATLLATLSNHRRERWDQPILVSTTLDADADADVSPSEPATARQILDEYLPDGARGAAPAGAGPRAGVLRLLNPLSWSEDAI
jgi:hypothetical protein